jgi:hypothetical protein
MHLLMRSRRSGPIQTPTGESFLNDDAVELLLESLDGVALGELALDTRHGLAACGLRQLTLLCPNRTILGKNTHIHIQGALPLNTRRQYPPVGYVQDLNTKCYALLLPLLTPAPPAATPGGCACGWCRCAVCVARRGVVCIMKYCPNHTAIPINATLGIPCLQL